jgi:hypothetical protein
MRVNKGAYYYSSNFCECNNNGNAENNNASAAGGVAPDSVRNATVGQRGIE